MAVDAQLAERQQELIDADGDKDEEVRIEDLISDLRGDRQDILAEAAERTDLQSRMNDMIAFLEEMPAVITKYDEVNTRRLVNKVTIFDEKIVLELKSGLELEVEA